MSNKQELAERQTDLSEDRTLMANERTFAGWIRTGLAAVGIGVGFAALFGKLEPGWVPRAIATVFVLCGVMIFYEAQKHGRRVLKRLNAHEASPMAGMNLQVVALIMSAAAIVLVIGLWAST